MQPLLHIQNLSKTFGNERVLADVNLHLAQHKVLSLLGSSGSGKTTLLKIIAGLEQPSSGEIFLNETEISQQPPQNRNIVYLYQEALLFPHFNVYENIAFGLRLKKQSNQAIKEKVQQMLHYLDIEKHAEKMPNQLSGGQKQRVSFGRAMVVEPKLLLLDEPFGALDSNTRQKMQSLFIKLVEQLKISALFVTHDLKEAIIMGDSIGKIQKGKLIQYESKQAFFEDETSGVKNEVDFWKGIK
ncbi:MAG: sulfate ABC transporter ATP-binding protein [Bacteroidetes bacterium HGW-Bacteroidetes-13]|jgi:putrescine transport system ATP-binding protein|nr:MAG: sulfate ABC transporter ATP-binding protein [Bacteroidetes bacterium HGW-Bacteroidetes-13]